MRMVKDRTLNTGDKVFVYYNLHKHCFSVKNVKTGLVVAHTDDITLEDAVFKVSEKGRLRVLSEKRKNVHAGVVGSYYPSPMSILYSEEATYNPYKFESFVLVETEEKLDSASVARLKDRKVYIQNWELS